MRKNLKGKECGKGICQRKDGLYLARFVGKEGKSMINVSEGFQKPETGWRKHGFSTGREDRVLNCMKKTLRYLI